MLILTCTIYILTPYDKYRNIIDEGNCSDPEELYNNYYKEFHGIIDGRGF